MFNRSNAIREWREELASVGVDRSAIEELESHLEEHLGRILSEEGLSEIDAFTAARQQLGSPHALATEFRKVKRLLPADKVTLWLSAFVLAALACVGGVILLSPKAAGTRDLLLSFHVATVTLGYTGMLLFAFAGGYSVLRRTFTKRGESAWFSILAPLFRWAIPVGLGFVTLGIITGGMWAHENLGAYWTWSSQEIGGACVWFWYVGSFVWLSFRSAQPTRLPALALFGGIVCLAAWFGGTALVTAPTFIIAIVVHLVLLFAALRLFWRAESQDLIA